MDYSVNSVGINDGPSTRMSEGLSQWHFPSVLETGALVESEPQDDQVGGSSRFQLMAQCSLEISIA